MSVLSPLAMGRAATLMQVRILQIVNDEVHGPDIQDEYEKRYGLAFKRGSVGSTICNMRAKGWIKTYPCLSNKQYRNHYLTPQGILVLLDAKWKFNAALGNKTRKPEKSPRNWFAR